MIAALKSFFAMFVTFFGATEDVGHAAKHMAGYLRESAKAFEDRARIEREQATAKLMAGYASQQPQAQLPATTTATSTNP